MLFLSATMKTNYFSMNIYAVKEDQRYQFQFRETYTKVGRTPSLTRLEKTVRGYEFGSSQIEVPKNILCIHFGGSYSSKVIKDCGVKLDHQIDRIVNHIEDVLNKDIEWKKECEIREREQERRRMIRDFNNRIAKDRKRQLELAMNESSELATLLRLKNYLRMMKGIFVDLPGKQRAAGLAWIALVKSEMKHIQPIETRIMRVKRAAERPVEESKQFWYAEYLPEEKCSTSDTEDIEAEDY